MNQTTPKVTYRGIPDPYRRGHFIQITDYITDWNSFEIIVKNRISHSPQNCGIFGCAYFPEIHNLLFNYFTVDKVYSFSPFQISDKELILNLLKEIAPSTHRSAENFLHDIE